MSTVQELVALLEETKPPKQLLVYHPKFFAPKYLVEEGVTHLLNTASGENMPDGVHPDAAELEKMGIKLLNLEVKDKANVEINEHFKTTGVWIGEALASGGRVLVNCYQGASRSATVVLAHIVQEGTPLREALVKVKSKRDVRPNDGFLRQLIQWEKDCQ